MSKKIKCEKCGDDHYLPGKVIENHPENPHLCMTCVEAPLKIAREKFLSSLSEEQKKLYDEYELLDSHRTSLIILD
mgnify:CR=1 FL=1